MKLPTIFLLEPYDPANPKVCQEAVGRWYAAHQSEYVLKEPSLMLLGTSLFVWCAGSLGAHVVEQAELMGTLQRQASRPGVGAAAAGSLPHPAFPRR